MSKLLTLKEKCIEAAKKLSQVSIDLRSQQAIEDLPPYNQYVAALQGRIKLQRITHRIIFGLLVFFAGIQQYDKYILSQKLEHREVFFTPTHIPNILKLRANTLSDSLVFEFADWFVTQLGNINFSMIEEKFKTLSKYMSPNLRSKFNREMRSKIELWKVRRVDQEITHEPITKFERRTEGRDTYFTVSVWVTNRKYVDGRSQPEEKELVTLVFRTSPIDSEKSWLFEVTDIIRKTPQELEDEKLIKEGETK